MSYTLKTAETTPWGSIDAPTVTCTDWGVSYTTGSHIDGAVLNAYSVPVDTAGRATGEVFKHELDGVLYPSTDAAKGAAYAAGLLAYWIKEN